MPPPLRCTFPFLLTCRSFLPIFSPSSGFRRFHVIADGESELKTHILRAAMATDLPLRYNHKFLPMNQEVDAGKGAPESSVSIKIVSYNILAQAYVKSANFPYAPSKSLRWKTRSVAIAKELVGLDADFLCLQELDEFEVFYRPLLAQKGYEAVYMKRPGKKRDGSGIFYKREKFSFVAGHNIDYNDIVKDVVEKDVIQSNKTASPTKSDLRKQDKPKVEVSNKNNNAVVRLTRDCVGIMGAFEMKNKESNPFIVASTHLYWDPALADVKLAQAKHLVKSLLSFRQKVESQALSKTSIPAFVCGDFNSQPKDPVYTFLTSPTSLSESVPVSVKAESSRSGNDEESEVSEPPLKKLGREETGIVVKKEDFAGFKSVYAEGGGEPRFTTYTPGFTGTLDYVFFNSESKVVIREILDVPGKDVSSVSGHLPNLYHPSDHLPVGAVLEFHT